MRGKLLSALVLAAFGVAVLSLRAGESQGAALPENPGEALRSGWQIAYLAVGYASLAAVNRPDNYLKTSFGPDEVHYYVLRKEGACILSNSQLVMQPDARAYEPWKHECLVIR